jgi:integrase/recombinase XerD
MLSLYRRHRAKCKMKGRKAKCFCPIWVQGIVHGETVRRSLDLTNWEAAQRKIQSWEIRGIKASVSLEDAYERFIAQHVANGSATDTIAKHQRLEKRSVEFLGNVPLHSITVDDISRFREGWNFAPLTTRNTIERMRAFFNFCVTRGWIEKNPAKSLKLPKIDEVEVKPYTPRELKEILEAVEEYPNWGIYKTNTRERVRAFVLTLRWTGMRIGDAVQLSREKVLAGKITLRTEKNGKRVSVPIHPELAAALKSVENGEYYFWSGNGKVSSAVSDWHRTIERLAKELPFKVHAHRFRHTLAAELISAGTPIAQVAAILGNTPSIVEKTYAQFIEQRQTAIDKALEGIWK